MRIVVGALLIIHGLITAGQSRGSFSPTGGTPNPNWLSWWPFPMGQSWLLSRLGWTKSVAGPLAGVLWLIAAACLIGAGLGLFGFIVPSPWWRVLAGVGATLSLALIILYVHPTYVIGIGASAAILLVLLWAKWPSVQALGS